MRLNITPRIEQSLKNRGLETPIGMKWDSAFALKTVAKLLKASQLEALVTTYRSSYTDDIDDHNEETRARFQVRWHRINNQLESIKKWSSCPDVHVVAYETIISPNV